MRRLLLLTAALVAAAAAQSPIIFVHGNGDDATKWLPVIWLFETNGYPADRLFAIRFTDPNARRENSQAEPFRSSTTDQAAELSALVTRVMIETKAKKVVLVGSSRGGMTIRNYLKNGGGAAVVSHAVLCGTPNHGVMATDTNLDMEFNGKGHFLQQLNAGSELVEGVKFLTLRSDKLDKFAQPNVGYDGPELKGAENVVLPNLDHREVAFHPLAFSEMYRFLTGQGPKLLKPTVVPAPMVSGLVTGFAGPAATNRPLAGVRLRVYSLRPGSAEREGEAVLETTTHESGAWGPVRLRSGLDYEFELLSEGRKVTYFMSGVVRSTALLNFRFLPPGAMQGGRLLIHRPNGYLSKGRDPLTLNGEPVAELLPGVPTRDSVAVKATAGNLLVELRGERIHARPAEAETETHVASLIWE